MSFGVDETRGETSLDSFLGGRLRIRQPRRGYRAATDPVLLAAFAQPQPGELVLDLGCGVGTAGLCLARRVPGIVLHGLELQPGYAKLADENADTNGIEMRVHTGDLRVVPPELRQISFDCVIANPPFYRAGAASMADDAGRDTANRETMAGLAEWIDTALRRLRLGGQLTMIHRTGRLAEILAGLLGRAGGIEVLPLAARAGVPAARVLVRARKGSSQALTLFSPLTVHQGSAHVQGVNDYTEDVRKVLRELFELLPTTRIGGNHS